MLKLLKAHKASRLLFAVLTLSIAIVGVVANYALSHDAIRAFQTQLALKDDDQFVLSGRLSDVEDATQGRYDGAAFDARSALIFESLLPPEVGVHPVRFRSGNRLTSAGPRPVSLVQVQRAFFVAIGAQLPPVPGWDHSRGLCVVGQLMAQSQPTDQAGLIRLDGRGCIVVAAIEMPETPPFFGLGDAIFLANGIDDVATDLAVNWTIYLNAPARTLNETALRSYLSAVFDLDYIDIWSGAAVVARAERLIGIVQLITNGLGLVILLVGGASIASLMSFSVTERAKEIAIKRTIGASKHQILREVVAESMLIGVVAIVIGVIGGVYLADYLKAPLAEFLAIGPEKPNDASLWPIMKTILQFLGVCALAGAVPGWRAATRDPVAVLRAP